MAYRTKLSLVAALLAGSAISAPALAGEVSGTVSDSSETRALQSAQLRIVELDRVETSDRDGSFIFGEVPAGSYTLEASYSGAETVSYTIDVPETGTVRVPVALGAASGDSMILVVGQRANQASALSRKRAADGISDTLTRDSVGQFPDQNVAESLRRLPGINVLNDQGEGRFVSVRGLDPNLNSSSVNGVRLPSPESDVRSVALDVISSDLIESIEVKKSLTPDMDADTIGASIEINTVSAFDRKKDLFTVKAEGSYNEYSDSISPKASLDFSTRLTDNIGIAGGLSYYNRKFETDNIEAEGWDISDDGVGYAEEVQYRDYDVERERISASLSLDFRASDTTELYARGIYSQFDDQEFRRRTTFKLDEEPSSGDATTALFDDADGEIEVERDVKDRFESQKIRSLTIGGETKTGAWDVSYSASWAKSTERENNSIDPTTFDNKFEDDGVSVLFDYSDERIPTFTVPTGGAIFADPAGYELDDIELTVLSDAQDEEFSARFDAGYEFLLGSGTFTVQGGAKGRWRTKKYDFNVEFYEDTTGNYTLADVLGSQTYRIADIGPVPGKTSPTDYFFDNFADFELQPIDSQFDSAVEDYRADEDILAGYLLGRYENDMVRIIAGVRVENTKNDFSANLVQLLEDGGPNNMTGDDLVLVTDNSFSRNYTDWLPSVNVRLAPDDNIVLRGAVYRSLVRPNLSKIVPRFVVEENDDGEREGEFGNPDLQPYKAWNFDASAEYYFSSNGAVSAAIFYKDVKDFIVDFNDEDGGTFNGITYDEAVIPLNGDSATIKGLELSFSQALTFLPDPLDGFLVQLNYTYTDAEGTLADGREIDLPSSSQNTFNATLGYEKGPISFRVAGTYRDKYLDEIGGDADEDRIVDEHFQLDISAKYKVTDNIQLFGEWVNVTDAEYFAYQNVDDRQRLLQFEKYGSTVKFGAKVKF